MITPDIIKPITKNFKYYNCHWNNKKKQVISKNGRQNYRNNINKKLYKMKNLRGYFIDSLGYDNYWNSSTKE